MSHMWLVNPGAKKSRKKTGKKRKAKSAHSKPVGKVMAKAKRKSHGKKRRSAAQKAATARTLAARGHKRSKRHGKKRRAIVRVTSRRSTVAGMPVTEHGRIRARKRKVKGYSANPLRGHRRRKHARRSNPLSLKSVPQTLSRVAMPVAGGVVLSIVADKLMPHVPVPASLQVAGKENLLLAYTVSVRALGIVAAMLVGKKFIPRHASTIEGAGVGALTVTATDLARSMLPGHLATTAAVHGYDMMAGYDMPSGAIGVNGYDRGMGNYDRPNINSTMSTVN